MRDSEIICIPVIITDVSSDDLGRVVIFAQSSDEENLIFIKDFFTPSSAQHEMNHEMDQYIAFLMPLIKKEVMIQYYINSIGDRVIISIKE